MRLRIEARLRYGQRCMPSWRTRLVRTVLPTPKLAAASCTCRPRDTEFRMMDSILKKILARQARSLLAVGHTQVHLQPGNLGPMHRLAADVDGCLGISAALPATLMGR